MFFLIQPVNSRIATWSVVLSLFILYQGHLPVHPKSSDPDCLLWNFDEVLAVMRSHSSVVCFMAGHDHDGGYHLDEDTGIHHVTFEGVIETPPDSNAFGFLSVYENRMELKGGGRVSDRILVFPQRSES